jgi:hypothetical protein
MGVPATRATTAEELADQLRRALAEPGPHLIDAVLRFRPDIEGLRAVAVLAVVLFHAGVPGYRAASSGSTSSS